MNAYYTNRKDMCVEIRLKRKHNTKPVASNNAITRADGRVNYMHICIKVFINTVKELFDYQ